MSTLATEVSPDRKRAAASKGAGRAKFKALRYTKMAAPAPRTPPTLTVPTVETPMTKRELVLTLLSRPEGASVEDIMQATDWQQHSVRGFLAGTVKKKLGFALTSSKSPGDLRRYRIEMKRGR